jgi:TATA-binding protein-associated factor Taf7
MAGYSTLRTDKVIRHHELDQGFILRANPELTKKLKAIIRNQAEPTATNQDDDASVSGMFKSNKQKDNFELVNLDREKRLYGVKVNSILYFATLVNLPSIIEAMKTLDNFNFYKSQDANQMLYVHPKNVDTAEVNHEELQKAVSEYDAIKEDEDFRNLLYDRLHNQPDSHHDNEKLKMRSGLSPISKNIINYRFKQKPTFNTNKVKKIEGILKDLIDFGFAEHVDEQLLDFDENGKLKTVVDGKYTDKKADGGAFNNLHEILSQDQETNNDIIKVLESGSVSSSNMDDYG